VTCSLSCWYTFITCLLLLLLSVCSRHHRPTDLSGYYLAFNGRLGRLVMDYELTVRGLLTRAEAVKSSEAGYPHTSVHEATAAAAADPTAAAAAVDQEPAAVADIESESGGSARDAATAAIQQGLESPLQATAAAAAGQGSVTGAVKGAAAAVAEAATGSSKGAAQASSGSSSSSSSSSSGGSKDQQRVKRVLMGHSLGGACAALEYVFNPSEYAAVVLVDPAIMAGLRSNGSSQLEQLQDGTAFTRSLASGEYEQPEAAAAAAAHEAAEAARVSRVSSSSSEASSTDLDALAAAASSSSSSKGVKLSRSESLNAAAAAGDVAFYATRGDDAQFAALLTTNGSSSNGNMLTLVSSRILALVQTAVMLSTVMVLSVLRPVIVLLLRSLVRSRKFWANTLRQAYYDQSKVTPAAVDAYRMPQLVKGWESGMVQFLLARLGAGGTSSSTSAAAAVGSAPMGGLEDAGLAKRFAAAVAANNTPVLIVHGAGDKLVPASNSFKLARLVKGCRLAVVKRAGHCPQEEEPELFADIVESFVARHTAGQGA
jgi:pimeloyl-ACP methyl ester carboxylesterase